jgi:hypothetical protein
MQDSAKQAPWKLRLFWVCWSIDALICLVIGVFFVLGGLGGSISSFNIGIWIAIGFALLAILGGGLWLKALGFPVFATALLLLLVIPGLLSGLFILLAAFSGTSWN